MNGDQVRADSLRAYDLRHARNDAEVSLRNGGFTGIRADLKTGEHIEGLVTAIDGDVVTVVQDYGRGTTKFDINEIDSTGQYSRDPDA